MKHFTALRVLTLSMATTLLLTQSVCAQESDDVPPATNTIPSEPTVIPYPLSTCMVSGEKLGEMGEPYVFVHEGHEIKLCCKSCEKKFNKEPETYLKKLEIKPYPLTTCLVSGETLGGEMGEPVSKVYEGQEIKFCCKSCIGKFEKDPDTYLKKMAEQVVK